MITIKKLLFLSLILAFGFRAQVAYAAKPTSFDSSGVESSWQATACTKIQDGTLTYSTTHYLYPQPLKTGFDEYGYNYQAHMFSGYYANVYLGGAGFPPYEGDDASYLAANPTAANHWSWPYRMYDLQMKWNDAWISNTDCDFDGKLDRHFGFPTYVGSGAWQTNQYSGNNGFASLTKFSAVPVGAYRVGPSYTGVWYTADGVEIGTDIWGEFAITQDVLSGEGALYVSPAGPGYGQY